MAFILSDPYFVIPWYLTGMISAAWVGYDMYKVNTGVNGPLKPGFIIIVFFFSILGLMLYLITARPKSVEKEADRGKAFSEYSDNPWKKAAGSAIHCVAGDGLGIFTAMAISRILDLDFVYEFWFEYLVGFAFGWFIFQSWAMKEMNSSAWTAFWKAGRAEFFSMVTVMGGMGIVMGSIRPLLIQNAPDPWTAAFWGFGAFGLLMGFIFTLPMNFWLIRRGYKKGMG